MIKQVSSFSKLPTETYLTLEIKVLFNGFKNSAIETCLWLKQREKPEALILGYGDTAYVSYFGGNTDEIEAFLRALSFKKMVTDAPFPFICVTKENSVFKRSEGGVALSKPEIPSLFELYEKLKFGVGKDISLPDFSSFAPDTSHLLRHGFAFSVCKDFGAAFVHTTDDMGVLKGISVKEELRNKGFGTKLLELCLDLCPKGLFAATEFGQDFYLKNGFLKEPYTIYYGALK